MRVVLERARADARALIAGPVDAILVENYGDSPFHPGPVPAETVASLTAAVLAVQAVAEAGRDEPEAIPVGVNVLRNDPVAALAIAAAAGCRFIRVNVHTGGMYTDQGWIEGDAAGTLRLRERLAPDVAILADVLVKHAVAPAGLDLERAARDAWERGWADALIVSGPGTGEPTLLEEVTALRRILPHAPLLVGSGVTEETVARTLVLADGAIIGTALKEGEEARANDPAGGAVNAGRVRRMVDAARRDDLGRPSPAVDRS
jgi:uncharacterized protein